MLNFSIDSQFYMTKYSKYSAQCKRHCYSIPLSDVANVSKYHSAKFPAPYFGKTEQKNILTFYVTYLFRRDFRTAQLSRSRQYASFSLFFHLLTRKTSLSYNLLITNLI